MRIVLCVMVVATLASSVPEARAQSRLRIPFVGRRPESPPQALPQQNVPWPGQLLPPRVPGKSEDLAHPDYSQVQSAEELSPENLQNSSWTYVPAPPLKQIKQWDILTVRVDELARMTAEGELERRKNALYDATLKDWIILDGLRWVKPSPQSNGDPRLQGTLNQLYRSKGDLETRESLAFNIAVRVVDIRPNGNLVIEGTKSLTINEEVWDYSLSGSCNAENIGPDNLILSRDVVDLKIVKKEHGSVATGYQRGWFQKIFDIIQPF